MEILTATDVYREFMDDQIALLEVRSGHRIADLGAGTGDFVVRLLDSGVPSGQLEVHAVDFVPEALQRSRVRVNGSASRGLIFRPVLANLDLLNPGQGIPLESQSFDSVLASLLLSYVGSPDRVLDEVFRILKPGGRLVASSLRRDADVSKLYADSLADRYSTRPDDVFGNDGSEAVDRSLPRFLNSAARIMDLEEQERFRFYDKGDLIDLLESAGFQKIRVARGLGDPPQAIVVTARRP
jgi:ubiquinone/menaquinone biosynthesis C-methylase UbiE